MSKKIKPSDLKAGDWIITQELFSPKDKLDRTCRIGRVINLVNYSQVGLRCWDISGEEVVGKKFIDVKEEIFLLDQEEVIHIKEKLGLEEQESIYEEEKIEDYSPEIK